MKNKFCESCRASIGVDEARVRAVEVDLSSDFHNTSMSGFWNSSHRMPGRRVLTSSHGRPSPPPPVPPCPLARSKAPRLCAHRGAGSGSSTRLRTAAGLGWFSSKTRHRTSTGLRFPPNGHAERAQKCCLLFGPSPRRSLGGRGGEGRRGERGGWCTGAQQLVYA